jgi:hypothetical protein
MPYRKTVKKKPLDATMRLEAVAWSYRHLSSSRAAIVDEENPVLTGPCQGSVIDERAADNLCQYYRNSNTGPNLLWNSA